MKLKKLAILSLILVVLFSGCLEKEKEEFEPKDEALKLEIMREMERRILPEQTIMMLFYLTNQVENEVKNVNLKITNPFGIKILKVNCGRGCICEWDKTYGCNGVSCTFDSCYYDSISSEDRVEIEFSLKMPSEEEISYLGRELKPEILLKYDYSGESILFIPILKEGEKIRETKAPSKSKPTTGPIHIIIESYEWVRENSVFLIYVEAKDVVTTRTPESMLTISSDNFKIETPIKYIEEYTEDVKKCDFSISSDGDKLILKPKNNIILPQKNPLTCVLKAKEIDVPIIKVPIKAEYSYTYEVRKIEGIRVEKSLLKIL